MPDPNRITRLPYEVTGRNLKAVSDDIYDVTTGKGFLSSDRKKRYAGKTIFTYRYRTKHLFDAQRRRLKVEITGLDFACVIKVPE